MTHESARNAAADIAYPDTGVVAPAGFPTVRPTPKPPADPALEWTVADAQRILERYGAEARDDFPDTTWRELIDKGDWRHQAICRGLTHLLYPERGAAQTEPRRLCFTCPVQAECLAYALNVDDRFGIWGGLPVNHRVAIHRNRPPVIRRALGHGTLKAARGHRAIGELPCDLCRPKWNELAAKGWAS